MQRVGLVGATHLEALGPQQGSHLAFAIDANVSAHGDGSVVFVAELPADLFGKPGRNGDRNTAPRLEHPEQLSRSRAVVGDVLHDLRGDDPVEGVVRERQA